MITLFQFDEEFRQYVNVNVGFDHESLVDDIDTALRKYIFPYCSREQFEASKDSAEDHDKELMSLIKSAAANLGLFLYMPLAKVNISSGGITYAVEKAKQASQEDKEELSNSFFVKGMAKLEDMLLFLEKNENATAGKFQAWKNSVAYTKHTSLLVRNATEFKIIGDSRQVFLSLIPYIEDVEFDTIQTCVSASVLSKLYSREFGTEPEVKLAYETLLFKYVQVIVRSEALFRALDQQAVLIDRYQTLTVHDDTTSNKVKGSKEASIDKIERKKAGLKKLMLARLEDMTGFIFKTAELLDYELPTDESDKVGPYKNIQEHGSAFFGAFSR